jgi:UDP-N-acetylglucosamine diphosphorylase/glucosamine-1-phosphate N-acetyltransferase
VCKVGGEIENSIIHSYSNKQHYGFLGHSYLGQWINLGAGTSNSDLKNNYSSIRITSNGTETDTGMTFLGSLIGDHTKTAICTRLNTGASIGACCNIISDQIAPKYLPPFTWLNNSYHSEYALDKMIDTAKLVFSRRGIIFTDSDRKLFREVFEYSKAERNV